jgi:hypothetical protein
LEETINESVISVQHLLLLTTKSTLSATTEKEMAVTYWGYSLVINNGVRPDFLTFLLEPFLLLLIWLPTPNYSLTFHVPFPLPAGPSGISMKVSTQLG